MEVPRKAVLFAGAVIAVVLALLLLNPWGRAAGYRLDYLRSVALEFAEAIDSRGSARVTEDFYSGLKSVSLVVTKPREKPVVISLTYSVLAAPSPLEVEEVIKGRPEDAFTRFRETCVYVNGSHVVVEPKPVVEYVKALEGGRTVHVVRVTLVVVRGELVKGAVLSYNSSFSRVYERTYDYSGVSSVLVEGQVAAEFQVRREDLLKVVVVEEGWLAG